MSLIGLGGVALLREALPLFPKASAKLMRFSESRKYSGII